MSLKSECYRLTKKFASSLVLLSYFLLIICADCGKNGPETNKEVGNDAISLLAEELSLQKNVADENLKHKKAMIIAAKKTSSHYQKEAEKCNSGMETCEEAREKAEAGLIEERKLSALWEKRAHEHGWKDERRVYQ